MTSALLQVERLCVDYQGRAAVTDVSFEVLAGETVGLVGGSGSGKTSVARAVLRLTESRGRILWQGEDLSGAAGGALRRMRHGMQMVFQDPRASLDPRMRVGAAIAEPLRAAPPEPAPAQLAARVAEALGKVGLEPATARRYPHELSGGQCQRVAIARAMIGAPRLIVCDEPVSSLDVSVQGQIVNLLLDLQRESGVALLFISSSTCSARAASRCCSSATTSR
jgi:ABC-type microcin C transport system duplicated ATPase subunit YejF